MRAPWLTKHGYAVRKPDGTYRGVYRDMATANEIWLLVELNERPLFDPAVEIVPCRVRPWVRFGMRARPLVEVMR